MKHQPKFRWIAAANVIFVIETARCIKLLLYRAIDALSMKSIFYLRPTGSIWNPTFSATCILPDCFLLHFHSYVMQRADHTAVHLCRWLCQSYVCDLRNPSTIYYKTFSELCFSNMCWIHCSLVSGSKDQLILCALWWWLTSHDF